MGKSAGSGGGGDQRNKDIEGRSSRPSGGGNVFGVDGVSKTGSTARDAAIGFTSGEGTGRAGANFDALQGATRETVDRAVAASRAAERQGANIAGQQQAAGAALGVTQPSSSVQQALAARRRDEGGVRAQPLREISPSTPGMTGPGSFMSGAQEISGVRPNITGVRPNITAAITQPDELTTEAFSSSPLASLLTQAAQTPAVDLSGVTNMALARGISNPTYEAELNRRAIAGDQEAKTLFDNALVKGYTQPSDLGVADRISSPVPLPPVRPTDSRISAEEVLGVPLPPVRPAGISALAPAQVGPPAAQMQRIGPAQDFIPGTGTSSFYSNLTDLGVPPVESISDSGRPTATSATQMSPQGEYYGEDLQQPDIFGTPGGEFTGLYGFPDATALGEFQTQAMRPSKAISQLMDFSLLSQGIGALTGNDPSEAALEGGRQSLRDIFSAGGQFNPQTGRVEAQLPSGQLQMNNFGMVTYSGMPDPNYTGPFANLVNPPEQERGGPAPIASVIEEEPIVDPCPPGFALVGGVCQPTDQTGGTTTGVPNPPAPPVFQPMYQPFQPQPLNPFVLSPTGAAIGRSV